jgi:hypothetical protein
MRNIVLLRQSDADTIRDVCEKVNGKRGGGRVNRHREDAPAAKGGGSLQLLLLTTPPNGDSGAAVGTVITVNSDGTYTTSETKRAVICLALN